jgi:phosphatidylserine decarboxylase
MFRLHKEGNATLIISGAFLVILNAGAYFFVESSTFSIFLGIISLVFYGIILQFFRNPVRTISVMDNNQVYAPADGKVVVIEETQEDEYFKDKRIQVSVFMSPFNVHVNRNPIGGKVTYFKYHEGKYLVAWHPKSSTENERTTAVISNGKQEVLFRQIAGALARRIKYYIKKGDEVQQGGEMGFIKFGSRVDLFLPLGTKINVKIDDVVEGNTTVIATLV